MQVNVPHFWRLCSANASQNDIQMKILVNSIMKFLESSLLMGFNSKQRFSSVASKKIDKTLKENNYTNELVNFMRSRNKERFFFKESDISESARLTIIELKLNLNGDNNREIIELIEATERAGSLCTRIMGAGGGGFFVCWAPPKHKAINKC